MTANPNAYDFVPSIWSWMGMATALSFVGTIGKIAWLGRKLSTSLFTALSAIILYQTFSQTLFFFLLALLIWAAISRISLQPQKLLLDTARLLPVLFLVVTSTDLVIAWFREKMYAPGGVQKVFDGINAVLPLNQIALFIFLLLIAIKVASKRKNIQLTPSAFTKPAAYLILISSLVFTGALTWNGAHQTEWSTPRQGLWGAAGLSPCGLPATLGYHDPNLASVLQEITDFETPSVYLPNSTQTLATIQAPNKATNSIAGAPNASGASFGTYHLEMEEEATGWFATPWYFIPSGSERLYFEAVGRITPDDGPTANQIELQYGILSGGEVTDFSSNDSGVSLDTVRWQTLEAGLSGKWNAVRAIGIDRQTTSWLGLANFRVAAGKLNLQAILDEGHYGNQAWISPRLVLQFPCLSISNMRQGRINSPGLLVSYQYIKDSPFEYMFDVYDYSSDTIIRGNLLRFKLRGPDWIEIPFSTRSHWS